MIEEKNAGEGGLSPLLSLLGVASGEVAELSEVERLHEESI